MPTDLIVSFAFRIELLLSEKTPRKLLFQYTYVFPSLVVLESDADNTGSDSSHDNPGLLLRVLEKALSFGAGHMEVQTTLV